MTVPLTVVIPTHGRPDLLVRTLTSLAECDLPANYAGCVVAENGGEHGAAAACGDADARLRIRYLYHAEGNKSATLNRVLEDVTDGLIVFLDDDVRLAPGVLTAYAAAAGRGPRAWFAGPAGVDYEREPPAWVKSYLPTSATGWEWGGGECVDRPEAMGFNWAAFAADLRALGGFDPDRGPGAATGATGQEEAMMRRLLDAGHPGRYLPGARVWHFVPPDRCSPGWVLRRKYRNGINEGLRYGTGSSAPTLLGYPRWMVRAVVGLWADARLNPTGGERARFARRAALASFRGRMAGCRTAGRRAGGGGAAPPSAARPARNPGRLVSGEVR